MESELDIIHIGELARRLGCDVVDYAVQKTKETLPTASDYHVRTLRLIVDYLLETYRSEFTELVRKMKISELATICESLVLCADNLFMDRRCNWGRIVTLYGYSAFLASYCASNHVSQDLVRKIGETVGSYVSANLTSWICRQGGWVSNLSTAINYNFN